jgi:uncharacterized protein YkwD
MRASRIRLRFGPFSPQQVETARGKHHMTVATRHEAYMLRLVNEARADAGARPLRFDGDLNQAADWHSSWMLRTDTFSHTGANGTRVGDRVENAGYDLTGSWAVGENLAVRQVGGRPGLWDDVRALHEMLMNSPSHRANLLSGKYDEAGIGIMVGEFRGVTVVMATQNFGRTSADDVRITRSVDADADAFVFATPAKSSATFTTQTPAEPAPVPLWLDAPWSDLL